MRYFLLILLTLCFPLLGEIADPSEGSGLEDALEASKKANDNYLKKFESFVKSNNVMGQATLPDGNELDGANKAQNADDGVLFQSPLTYHDLSFDDVKLNEQAQSQNSGPNATPASDDDVVEFIPAWISAHGKVEEGGGSSQLERKTYELHKEFEKQEDKKNKENKKEGESFFSIFKRSTREVVAEQQPPPQNGATPQEPEKIAIWREEIVPEAREQIAQVGTEAGELLIELARDEDKKDQDNALANSTYLYEGADRSTKALWDSTLANRGQLIANENVGSAGGIRVGDEVKLSEEIPDCQTALDEQRKTAEEDFKNEPKLLESKLEEIDQVQKQCEQTIKAGYNEIAPKWVEKKSGGASGGAGPNSGSGGKGPIVFELKAQGVDEEQGYERDMRVQLEVLAEAGKDPNDVETNWEYSDSDAKQSIVVSFDAQGNPDETAELTVKEQLDLYNQQLQQASESYAEVKEYLPDLESQPEDVLQYQIEPGTKSVMEINTPTSSQLSEFGIGGTREEGIASTYNQLLEERKNAEQN